MVIFKNNRIFILLDESYKESEDLIVFIESLLWYLSHIESGAYSENENFYLCELIRMMLPNESQINLKSKSTDTSFDVSDTIPNSEG